MTRLRRSSGRARRAAARTHFRRDGAARRPEAALSSAAGAAVGPAGTRLVAADPALAGPRAATDRARFPARLYARRDRRRHPSRPTMTALNIWTTFWPGSSRATAHRRCRRRRWPLASSGACGPGSVGRKRSSSRAVGWQRLSGQPRSTAWSTTDSRACGWCDRRRAARCHRIGTTTDRRNASCSKAKSRPTASSTAPATTRSPCKARSTARSSAAAVACFSFARRRRRSACAALERAAHSPRR